MSPTLSRHFGHLFVRDPLIVIEEQLHSKDDSSSYHFEVSLFFVFLIKKNVFFKYRT